MFIELTTDGRKHLFPISAISVHQQPDGRVLIKERTNFDYFVDESYEEIVSLLVDVVNAEMERWRGDE